MTDVKVEGLTTLRTTLRVAARRVEDFSAAHQRTSTFLAARGRADAPRLTGRLASSVRARSDSNEASTESALSYARYVHWGTSRQAAQPWLLEGRDDTEKSWMNNYSDRVEDVIGAVRGA